MNNDVKRSNCPPPCPTDQIGKDIFSDIKYICNSASLISDALAKGSDILQQSNGDILVTEQKTFTYRYTWDTKKGGLVRAIDESRRKKRHSR